MGALDDQGVVDALPQEGGKGETGHATAHDADVEFVESEIRGTRGTRRDDIAGHGWALTRWSGSEPAGCPVKHAESLSGPHPAAAGSATPACGCTCPGPPPSR